MLQNGAYRALLDRYYCAEGPLPKDPEALYRMAGAFTPEEREAVDAVVTKYFVVDGEHIRNGRADEEIVRRSKFSAERSATGKRGAAARWHSSANGSAIASAYGSQIARPQSQKKYPSSSRKHAEVERLYSDEQFAKFYQAYPRKKGKMAAAEAWKKLNGSRPKIETILSALEAAKKSDDWNHGMKFIPYPATWLNGRHWEDEQAPETHNGKPFVY